MKDTDDLIRRLAADARPMRHFPAPVKVVAFWSVVAVVGVTVFAGTMGTRPDLLECLGNPRYLIDLGAALATGLGAAWAAVVSVMPGRPTWQRLIPVVPTLLWLGSLIYGALPDQSPLRVDLVCLPVIALVASLPCLLLLYVMRRGVVLSPCLSMFLAAAASASIAYIGLRLVHLEDAGRMILVWQFGSVVLLSLAASCLGSYLFPPKATVSPGSAT